MEQYELNWKNYYDILQVSQNAKLPEIKGAYKKLAKSYHPDTTTDSTATDNMADINEAFEILSDSARRATYDQVFVARSILQKDTDETVPDDSLRAVRDAVKRASGEKSKEQIMDDLVRTGISQSDAEQIIDEVFASSTRSTKKGGSDLLGCGVSALIISGILYGIFYLLWPCHSSYINNYIMVGLLIIGLICVVMGMYQRHTH